MSCPQKQQLLQPLKVFNNDVLLILEFIQSENPSLVPRLSPRANEKSKERGEPGRIYHVRNVIGREDLITCGRTNELAHALRTECSCDSFMADRMGLDSTILHYLAVRKAMVSVHKPVHSKITLTYSLTWQADRCTLPGEGFQGAALS